MPTYPNDHEKVKKWIFAAQFAGNWFEFDLIRNEFWSSTIWAIRIQVSTEGLKIQKIPEFNLSIPELGFQSEYEQYHISYIIFSIETWTIWQLD